jgi:hypothetical protein
LNRLPKLHQQKFRLLSSPPLSRLNAYQILVFTSVSLISHPSK